MAALRLASLPSSFTKMLQLDRNSSFLPTKNLNVPYQIQCMASNNVSDYSQPILRRSANFQPSIWSYDYIQSLSSEYNEESYREQSRVLREEVRVMLCKLVNHVDKLEMIDVLQRLGVAYHFNNEISNILENAYNMDTFKRKKNLYATALEFRLFRQHGFNLSADVFLSFQDEMGTFMKCLSTDVEEMLSLYEASFLSFEEETILDEARDFTSNFLKEYVSKDRENYMSVLINHALELPLHWRVPRWEAHWFINAYETRHNMSPPLLRFAKLDFNMGQSIHQEDLKYTSRWWKGIGFARKLSFARDRLVENFLWAMGINFKPDFGYFRRAMTKVNFLITTIDDIYDVYGTLEELELFTEAIDRWDPNNIDSLPHYMKICFLALHNLVNEIALETVKENGHNMAPHLKNTWADLCKSYFVEAKWYHSGYMPSLGEYMENAWISISAPVILVHAFFFIPTPYRKENLVSLEEYHNLIRYSAMILRIANDLGTSKRESVSGDVPKSIQCYMNETGACEADAREHVKSMICKTWKKMNEEVINCSNFSQDFTDMAVNLARLALCFYHNGDGFSVQDIEAKSRTLSLIIQPMILF